MQTFRQFRLTEENPSWVLPAGTPVSWVYRDTHGYGHIKSVDELGKDQDHTRYNISPADKAYHEGEGDTVKHWGSNIRKTTDDAVKAHVAELRAKDK